MSEPWKLVIGFIGVVGGFAGGLFGLFAIMSGPSAALLDDRPTVTFLVSVGLCGGGAALVGWVFLSIIGYVEKRSKRAKRRKKKGK